MPLNIINSMSGKEKKKQTQEDLKKMEQMREMKRKKKEQKEQHERDRKRKEQQAVIDKEVEVIYRSGLADAFKQILLKKRIARISDIIFMSTQLKKYQNFRKTENKRKRNYIHQQANDLSFLLFDQIKRLRTVYNQLQKMKKFRLENVKIKIPEVLTKQKTQAKPVSVKEIEPKKPQRDRKKQELEKQMQSLAAKLNQANSNITQTKKMLDIDLFLKKQKQKRLDYASKLNEQYDKEKKDRQKKLYKQHNREQTQKLSTAAIRNQIPLNIITAVDQLKKKENTLNTWILEDHYHKLDQMLLDKTKSDLFSIAMKEQEQKNLKFKEENSWKKVKEISNNCLQTKYFPVDIQNNQLEPSDYGQSLMSAFTLMPKGLSEELYKQSQSLDKQLYLMCKFFPGGEKKSVLTNEWIQVRQFTHKYINVSSRNRDGLTFWSTLLEKCYKKLFYQQQLSNSLFQTVQNVYGIDPQVIPFNNKITIKQNFHKIVSTLLKMQPTAAIGLINDRADTYNRIYPLTQIIYPIADPIKKKKKHQNEQQKPISKDILFNVCNPYSGTILTSTFVNKFTINQLFQKFNKLIVLRQYPKKWSGTRVKIQFLSNGPHSFTGSDWTKNNQYSFTLTKTVNARIILRRKWGNYIESDKQIQEDKLIFGFILFKTQEGESEISCMRLEGLISKIKSNEDNGSTYAGKLQKGTYILVPYSHLISQQYTQSFNLDILVERDDVLTINKAKISQYYYQNSGGDQKIIQKLQNRVKYQKPKNQKIVIPKLFGNSEKMINDKYIQSLGLTVLQGVSLDDFYLPGRLKGLLVGGQQKEEKKERTQKKSAQSSQVEQYQRQQALRILLGYDALEEDINHGQMRSIVEDTSDEVDLSNFELGQEGLMAVIQSLMSMPRLTKLDLTNNALNDSSITYLCYYLQKGNRAQLKQLILTGNSSIGKMGIKALKGMKNILVNLQIKGVLL